MPSPCILYSQEFVYYIVLTVMFFIAAVVSAVFGGVAPALGAFAVSIKNIRRSLWTPAHSLLGFLCDNREFTCLSYPAYGRVFVI